VKKTTGNWTMNFQVRKSDNMRKERLNERRGYNKMDAEYSL
jgi:hypothetical protein